MIAEIVLEGLSFYAYHGFYEEEKKSGNRFLVDIKVTTQMDVNTDFDNLNNTVDYEKLYGIIKSEMTKSSSLLENVGKNILDQVFIQIKNIESAEVTIAKLSPPIGGPCKQAKVTLRKTVS